MKPFQCSICECLDECDTHDTVFCKFVACVTPETRDKEDEAECLKHFKELPKEKIWHEPFEWELDEPKEERDKLKTLERIWIILKKFEELGVLEAELKSFEEIDDVASLADALEEEYQLYCEEGLAHE